MKKCEEEIPVYEFRPILEKGHGEVFRYANGKWTKDDGEFDIAFALPSRCRAFGVSLPSRYSTLWSWVKHGKWGAFVGSHPRGNAWHYMLRGDETKSSKSWRKESHENYKASESAANFVLRATRCCSTVGPEFHINDPYIENGMLRIKETKEIIKFPDIFKCQYCGDIDWRAEELSDDKP